jgi:hypothetical protein
MIRPVTLWEAFIAAVHDLAVAVRRMPTWVYLLIFFAAALANVLAVVVR